MCGELLNDGFGLAVSDGQQSNLDLANLSHIACVTCLSRNQPSGMTVQLDFALAVALHLLDLQRSHMWLSSCLLNEVSCELQKAAPLHHLQSFTEDL